MPRTKWFLNVKTIDELKKVYRKLAMQYHPDICKLNNAEENMKQINAEYEKMFIYLQNTQTEEQKKYNTKAGHNFNDGYREAINSIIHLLNIEIEICGSWIWISGQTKQYKDIFKSNGYFWAGQKKKWYWRPQEYKSNNRKSMTMDYIRNTYGSERIQNKPYEQLDKAI